MVSLRAERAQLLGYPTYADYRLDDQMAKTPGAVRALLGRVGARAEARTRRPRRLAGTGSGGGRKFRARALGLALLRREAAQARATMSTRRRPSPICSSTGSSRPPSTRRQGCSGCLRGAERHSRLAPDVRVWELLTLPAAMSALFFGDYFARPSKHSGAWMTPARAGKAARQYPPADRERDEFRQGRRWRSRAPFLRRRADSVPRIRPRPARHPVGRDLSADRGDERLRFGRIALAALRALVRATGNPSALRAALPHRRADAGRYARKALEGPHLQPGLRHGGICASLRWSISNCIRSTAPERLDVELSSARRSTSSACPTRS